jgi:hypothetical protein
LRPRSRFLYFFREGWNPSGTRFIAFLKNADRPTYTGGWSISADGKDVRLFYMTPSHHAWLAHDTILEGRQYTIYRDDGSGRPHRVADVGAVDFDPTVLPGGQWFLLDTYPLEGYQHLVLFHRPSRLFLPLAKMKNTAQLGTDDRVDLHARISRDGRTVCIDATHDGLGRQMCIVPIGPILDHPPRVRRESCTAQLKVDTEVNSSEVALVDPTEARKATVRRFGRSDRSARFLAICLFRPGGRGGVARGDRVPTTACQVVGWVPHADPTVALLVCRSLDLRAVPA